MAEAFTLGEDCSSRGGGLYAAFAQAFPARLRAGGTGLVIGIGIGRGGAALSLILAGLLFAKGWPRHWVAPAMAAGTLIAALSLSRLKPSTHEII